MAFKGLGPFQTTVTTALKLSVKSPARLCMLDKAAGTRRTPFVLYFTLAGLPSVSNATEYTKTRVAWMSGDRPVGMFTNLLITKTHEPDCQDNVALLPGLKPKLNQSVAV